MTIEEFEKKLREKLSILEEKEINDIINEYKEYIDEKMKNGATEVEAIKEFGNLDELANELLKAYKINVEQPTKDKNFLNNLVDIFITWIDSIVRVFSNKNSKEIIRILLELFLILMAIAFCHIPFEILGNIGFNMFDIFGNSFGLGLFKIWKFILEFVYLITAIVLFAKIFEKRYINTIKIENKIEEKRETKQEVKQKQVEKIEVVSTKKGLLDVLSTMCLWFLKFMAFWILFGISCYILGLGICLGIGVYLLLRGVTYYGIYISILMLLVLGILAFIIIFNFIASRKNNIKFLIISFVICFITLGISFSMSTVELTTTKFINEIPHNYEKEIKIETLAMDGNYYISGPVHYEIDESLQNEMKIEYLFFPEFHKINPIINIDGNNVNLSYKYYGQFWNSKILEDVIANLKERTIYNYDFSPKITIYTSSQNINKLKENKQKEREERRYNNELYGYCYRQLEYKRYNDLSNECQNILDDHFKKEM